MNNKLKLTVVISYRDRLESLKSFALNVKDIDKGVIQFRLISLGDKENEVIQICKEAGIIFHYIPYTNNNFNTGMAHNYGFKIAESDWVMKQDIDCIPWHGFYDRLLYYWNPFMDNYKNFAIIPAVWVNEKHSKQLKESILSQGDLNYIINNISKFEDRKAIRGKDKSFIGGTEFIFHKKLWCEFGGSPEQFEGWGGEDNAIIFLVNKLINPDIRLKEIEPDMIDFQIRDRMILPLNKICENEGLVLIHIHHKRNQDHIQRRHNKELLYDLVRR